MSHNIHEIIRKTPIRVPLSKLPPQNRPEERLWVHPHLIFHQMQETGSGHHHDPGIPTLPEINISNNQNNNDKNKTVCKKPSTGKNIFKQNPAYGLIDQIRQKRTHSNESIINMTFERRKSKARKVEYAECDAKMTEDEHYMSKSFSSLRHLSCQVHSAWDITMCDICFNWGE